MNGRKAPANRKTISGTLNSVNECRSIRGQVESNEGICSNMGSRIATLIQGGYV